MNIYFLEAYDTGSHRYFHQKLEEQLKFLKKDIKFHVISLKGRHWRWRLQGSHFQLGNDLNSLFKNNNNEKPDLIITTSLTDSAALRGLLSAELRSVPLIQYMHENQMSYPLAPNEHVYQRDHLIREHIIPAFHLNQILAADYTIFNSSFHQRVFFEGLEKFCLSRPDYSPLSLIKDLKEKTHVIPIPIEFPNSPLATFSERKECVLWNHRWEHDKNPHGFFQFARSLLAIKSDVNFCLLGENNHSPPPEFTKFKNDYPQNITAYGYLESRQAYLKQLSQNRLLPVTSYHDFLGLSVLEAMAFGVIPLLPNRLVYPELIPPELHSELLYDSEAQLLERSLILLKDGLQPSKIKLIEDHLQQYHQTQTATAWAKLFRLLE